MNPNVIIIHPRDNVGIALVDIKENQVVRTSSGEEFPALSDIPFSHKVALAGVETGGEFFKYGEFIGKAARPVRMGEWVHTHNLEAGGTG